MMNSPETRFSLIGRLGNAENADAWNEFVQLYQPLIFRIARRRGLQHADAAEVSQEVLARVSRAVESWEPDHRKGTFRGWLYRITRNLTIDFLRKSGRQPVNLDSLAGIPINEIPEASGQQSSEFQLEYEQQLFLWAAKRVQAEFRPATWKAFWKTAVEGIAVRQAASELEMTTGAIYVARSRVMRRLAEEVKLRNDHSTGERTPER